MSNGHVYVLVNASIPNLVKVGKTSVSVLDRAQNLSSATGVPTAFEIYKAFAVTDCDAAEKKAHEMLEIAVGRPNKNREFFSGSAATICAILENILAPYLEQPDSFQLLFQQMLDHARTGQFTIACVEFEHAWKNGGSAFRMDFRSHDRLAKVLGGYLACCIASRREPQARELMVNPSFKAGVMSAAIEAMTEWHSDPAGTVIAYIRAMD